METTNNEPQEARSLRRRRGQIMLGVTGVLLVLFLVAGAWWMLFGRYVESTDDAYVGGNVVQVASRIAGTVDGIKAEDTDFVKRGQVLITLDPDDAKLALQRAESALTETVRETRTLYLKQSALKSAVASSKSDLERAQSDLSRREKLAGTGAVSQEEIIHLQTGVINAQAMLKANEDKLEANTTLLGNTDLRHDPNVAQASDQVRMAWLALERTQVIAPVSGYVAKRSAQVGTTIAAGMPLLSIVPLDDLWVDANFKETQIRKMRIGQPVTLHSDLYGSKIVFHGKVMGLSPGTGSAFALLPAQNASGNWIKIVQRIPVRIALDPRELAAHPLRVSLSMTVEVDIKNDAGTSLNDSQAVTETTLYGTDIYAERLKGADKRIEQIISTNGKL